MNTKHIEDLAQQCLITLAKIAAMSGSLEKSLTAIPEIVKDLEILIKNEFENEVN